MLIIARWKVILILLVIAGGILAVIPNFFTREEVNSWPGFLPKNRIVLGLDLQGGAYLLYEVDREDYTAKRLQNLVGEVRRAMLEAPRIGYTGLGVQGDGVQLRIRDPAQIDIARERLEQLRNPMASNLLGGGAVDEFELTVSGDGVMRLSFSADGLAQRIRGIVQQSMEVISRRIDELGTTEPSIQRQGEDRILVEAPGLGDPERLKAIVGQTAALTFHMVREAISSDAVTSPPAGTIILPSVDEPGLSYILDASALMSGEDLADAQAAFEQQTNQPVVSFRLTTSGGRTFAEVTAANVGRQFAIVLDDEVISAPVIQEPIPGGTGQISGNFTVQTANDLAILLRAGSLPAKLTILEERSVGPGLGADSIEAGEIAAVIGAIAVGVFIFLVYGLFGLLANLAVIVNVVLIFAVLTTLGATLTLPGIAGIVLTIGTAVDSNVLIYERIREEARQGRSAIAAIDLGFKRALGTILDANITTLIAALALLLLGSGPIRGFAITYAIGIATTIFTAFTFTRLLVAFWYDRTRPAKIAF
ncbi:protein translocase subunit SecD [Bauldia sp.]|uniref:protein translocase subunit SecD n=1 Tax=Bauldia sp. TaxID=2575872 RepID=UPI003BA8B7E4